VIAKEIARADEPKQHTVAGWCQHSQLHAASAEEEQSVRGLTTSIEASTALDLNATCGSKRGLNNICRYSSKQFR